VVQSTGELDAKWSGHGVSLHPLNARGKT
jgi:hypothetical protein